ncbi:MAG: GGDEF domain-containing protein, partial [Nitrospirae bacterium]|nr:GGDEF domain-containing protein [Nitrospirota bacterium]
MKKHLITSLFLLLVIGGGGYLISDYFLERMDREVVLHYKALAVLNKTEEMRYHLISLHAELLTLRYRNEHKESGEIQWKLAHSHEEMKNLQALLVGLREDEKLLKKHAFRVEGMERGLKTLSERIQRILPMENSPEKTALIEETLQVGEHVETLLERMEEGVDEESRQMGEHVVTISGDLKFYRSVFLLAEYSLLLFFILVLIHYNQNRVRNIRQMIRGVREGGDDVAHCTMSLDADCREIGVELLALMEMMRKNEKNLKSLTVVDPLTGVFNRRYFQNRLRGEMKRFVRYNTLFSVAIIDVDHFKKVNDTYGHQQGDVVLKEVARILKENTRETDLVARYGGEEFVILYSCTDKAGAFTHLDRLRTSIETHTFTDLPQQVTASMGIADATGKTTAEDVIRDADAAL